MKGIRGSLAVSCILVAACQSGKKNKFDASAYDSAGITIESAVAAMNQGANDSEPGSAFAVAGTCDLTRFSPAIGSPSCAGTVDNKTVTSNLNSCTAGQAELSTFSGTVALAFNTPTTCDDWVNGGALPTSGSVTRTSSNFLRLDPNGSSVTTVSTTHRNYKNEEISGGVKTTFGASTRQFDILGLQRVRKSSKNLIVFDHSVHSTSPFIVTGTRAAGNRLISSGIMVVDHNLAKYSTTTVVSQVGWDSSCCHPTSGSASVTLSGNFTGAYSANFATGTCGLVEVKYFTGDSELVQLADCE